MSTIAPAHLASSIGLTLTSGATQYTTKSAAVVAGLEAAGKPGAGPHKASNSSGAAAALGGALGGGDAASKEPSVSALNLQGVVGYNGSVRAGLLLRPDDNTLIYPLGSTIVLRDLVNNTQTFLRKNGHDRSVSCLALSPSGKMLATGQVTHMGFSAVVIVWNLETREAIHRLTLHKGAVQDLAFSADEKCLATLGGRDDNKLVIWDVASGEPICGATAANETACTVRWFNTVGDMLVTGGAYNLRVWQFDLANRKIRPSDCQLGQLKRVVNSIVIDEKDEFMYCATKTGDLIQVSLGPKLFKNSGPPKKPFSQGIECVIRAANGDLIVGAGDGTIAVLEKNTFRVLRKVVLEGGISSLVLNAAGDHFFAGTHKCNVYLVHFDTFQYEWRGTCHYSRINDIAFPNDYSELFATCSMNDIRVWHSRTRNELLRIQVPNLECLCVAFTADGKQIISGWDDGKIRAFTPQTGTPIYEINDAHRNGVTAITATSDCKRIISGGGEGMVRVWEASKQTQKMIASMKEHKGRVNCVQVNANDTECVSASADGSCIVWNIERFVRNNCLFASTQFRAILYHPDQSQLLTTGSDRKLTYWDAADGNPIRILDGSDSDVIYSLAVTADGTKFVSAGGDKLVKVWAYDDGICHYKGVGHSGAVLAARIAPDQKTIVTCGEEGAIFIWQMPSIKGLDPTPEHFTATAAAPSSSSATAKDFKHTDAKAAPKSPATGGSGGAMAVNGKPPTPKSNAVVTKKPPSSSGKVSTPSKKPAGAVATKPPSAGGKSKRF